MYLKALIWPYAELLAIGPFGERNISLVLYEYANAIELAMKQMCKHIAWLTDKCDINTTRQSKAHFVFIFYWIQDK